MLNISIEKCFFNIVYDFYFDLLTFDWYIANFVDREWKVPVYLLATIISIAEIQIELRVFYVSNLLISLTNLCTHTCKGFQKSYTLSSLIAKNGLFCQRL